MDMKAVLVLAGVVALAGYAAWTDFDIEFGKRPKAPSVPESKSPVEATVDSPIKVWRCAAENGDLFFSSSLEEAFLSSRGGCDVQTIWRCVVNGVTGISRTPVAGSPCELAYDEMQREQNSIDSRDHCKAAVKDLSGLASASGRCTPEAFRASWPWRWEGAGSSTGTAFVVGRDGQAVTNHHVVADCRRIGGQLIDQKNSMFWVGNFEAPERLASVKIRRFPVEVIDSDSKSDLALVRVTIPFEQHARIPEPSPLRLGEEVVVFGFPLSDVVDPYGNLTTGVISGLRGHKGSETAFQITAPTQPGSSGSAVMNRQGEVVGVVHSGWGNGQNINWAASPEALSALLKKNGVAMSASESVAQPHTIQQLAELARSWTFKLICWE